MTNSIWTSELWNGFTCNVCGHLRGDHESIGLVDVTDSEGNKVCMVVGYTCDDDCDEDLKGYCHVGRLFND